MIPIRIRSIAAPAAARPLLAMAMAALLTAAMPAQDEPAGEQPAPPADVKWPKLKSAAKSKLKLYIRRLDDEDPEKAAEAAEQLVALGAGAAPRMLARLDDSGLRDDSPLPELLDRIVTAEYLARVLDNSDHKVARVRRWAVRWLARAHDQAALPALKSACEDDDEAVAWLGWVGRGGLADTDAIAPLIAGCKADFRGRVELLASVLPAARGVPMSRAVLDQARAGDELTMVAGLRLCRYLTPREHAPLIAVSLNHSENNVKKAAINALRVLVDGDEPLEKLSVFQAIEQAKAWQERLR